MTEVKCVSTFTGHLEKLLWTDGELFLVNVFSQANSQEPTSSELVCLDSTGTDVYHIKYKITRSPKTGAEIIGYYNCIYEDIKSSINDTSNHSSKLKIISCSTGKPVKIYGSELFEVPDLYYQVYLQDGNDFFLSFTYSPGIIDLYKVSPDGISKFYHRKLPLNWGNGNGIEITFPGQRIMGFTNNLVKHMITSQLFRKSEKMYHPIISQGSNRFSLVKCTHNSSSKENEIYDYFIHISQKNSSVTGSPPPNFLDYIMIEPTTGREIVIPASEKVEDTIILNKTTILANIKTSCGCRPGLRGERCGTGSSCVYQHKIYRIDNEECIICMDNPKENLILVPCGHVGMCSTCIKSLEICPICREEVTQYMKHYAK